MVVGASVELRGGETRGSFYGFSGFFVGNLALSR
jgi:hypothetical protein